MGEHETLCFRRVDGSGCVYGGSGVRRPHTPKSTTTTTFRGRSRFHSEVTEVREVLTSLFLWCYERVGNSGEVTGVPYFKLSGH